MKISLEWLCEYLPGALDAHAAADALTLSGLPTEHIDKVGDDWVLDVEVTSNRGDCLSHVGIARELSALLNRPCKDSPLGPPRPQQSAGSVGVDVVIEAAHLCPQYTARVIRGVKVGPSPDWMRRRLEAVGLRSINNVVDITNYVMLETGQPLHAFDYDRVLQNKIIVRLARTGEKLLTIDGHERPLGADMLVIADARRPVALAGVMGGKETEVSDATVNVLLESARFDPLCVRKTARKLALMSDSSYRFERGIDPTLPERASRRATDLLEQLAHGRPAGDLVRAGPAAPPLRQLSMRLSRLQSLLGTTLPVEQILSAFDRLQLSPRLQNNRIDVTIPSYRLDLNLEVDLIEEAIRVIGYDKVPMRDEISIRLTPPDLAQRTSTLVRETLVAGGYFEAVTFSFVSDALADLFKPAGAFSLARADASVRKTDAHLRPSILPGLLESVCRNQANGVEGARLFEIGSTFWQASAEQIEERRCLGLVGSTDLHEVRGVVEGILSRLDPRSPVQIHPDRRAGFGPAACGRIDWGGKPLGYIGKVDRAISDKLGLRQPPAVAELDWTALTAGARHVPQLRPLPRFPAIRRDLSLILPEEKRYEAIEQLVQAQNLQWLEAVEYVTTYRGKPLETGQKSVTITLVFRSDQSTLTSESVEQSVQTLVAAARSSLGATLRV